MRRLWRWGTLAMAAIVGGCGGPMTIQPSNPTDLITGFYDYGAAGRDLKLTVYGDPFAMPQGVFARVVEADVHGPLLRQPTHPALNPGPSARPGYELVFVFSPAPALNADAICQGRIVYGASPPPPPQGGVVKVRALGAFCVAGRAASDIVGLTDATGAGDVRFYDLMGQMMRDIFRPDQRDFGSRTNNIPL